MINIQNEFQKMLNWELLKETVIQEKENFLNAKPFQHIVLDGLFNKDYLDLLLDEFDTICWSQHDIRDDKGIQVKLRSNWQNDNDIPPVAFLFIQLLNSGNFLKYLSLLTSIKGMIPDPYLTDGGFNQINRDGHLAVHSDGNWHDLMRVHRRLNVILYLNKDWNVKWGGNFELWNQKLTKCVKSIQPIYNRLVIFKTDDFSYHGHPNPLNCPESRSRRSLILYYYTNTRPKQELEEDKVHRALWKKSYNKEL